MPHEPTTILIVDDKEGTRYTVSRLLQRERYTVREAATGEEALRLAAELPDLIILDIKLPDLNGYEVCRRIKSNPATSAIPVLHLSATFADSESRSQGLEGGADGYLTYPVEPRELVASVEALLRVRRAERVARERGELLRVTLASIGDGVITTDTAGRITSLNAVAETLTGWPTEDAIGKPLEQVFHVINENTREPIENPVARALREGTVVGLANHSALIARDGMERIIDDSAAPIRDAQGRVVGVVMVFRDVTERRRAEQELLESQEQHRALVSQVKEYAIFRIDLRGFATTWNEGVQRVLGYPEGEFIGMDARRLFTPEDAETGALERELAEAAQGGSASDDRWMIRKEGLRFWASGITTALRDRKGGVVGFTKVMRDLTERKQAEDLLQAQAEALREADRRKDEFLAMLAHELRNPLAPIRNAVQLLGMIGSKEPAAQQAQAMIERQVEHLVRLVDDLLDVSRITRGRIQLQRERIDLAAVLFRAIEGSRPLIDARRHAFEAVLPEDPLPIDADAVRLAQVFWNLLNNAAKYTPEGGRIRLAVERKLGPGSTSEVLVRVRDTGMGIPREMLPRVFELFTQVEHTIERAEGGLGIGLTLVRRLTEMHGGKVEALSEGPGLGSEFLVRLPLVVGTPTAEPAGPSSQKPPVRAAQSRRILVVDDNRDSADSLATLLRLFGNDVRTAYDGRQALAVAGVYRPDVVLLDLGLPGLNGFEVAKQLRTTPGLERLVLVALTGFGTEEDRNQTRAAGFDHHLIKPTDLEALQKLLSTLPV